MERVKPKNETRRVAYLVSWFPALTETFILREMIALEKQGVRVEVFSLFGPRTQVKHEGAEPLIARARHLGLLPLALFVAQLKWLVRSPLRYLGVWGSALKGNISAPDFLWKALYVVPKAALLALELEKEGIRHVHAHWATHPALAAFVIKRLTGIRYSVTCHAHDIYVERAMLFEKLVEADQVVTISHFNRKLLSEWYGPAVADRTTVVRCGVDESWLSVPEREEAGATFRWLCVAGLKPYKGHSVLLKACASLKQEGHRFMCTMVGDGPERKRLEAMVDEYGLQDCVEFVGGLPSQEVRALLEEADAAVLPSIIASDGQMEGIPVFLMEALASGRPAVASDLSGISELVVDGETGLLAEPSDDISLAEAMAALMEDPELGRRLGRAGRRRVEEEFDVTRSARMLRGLLSLGPATEASGEAEREGDLAPELDGDLASEVLGAEARPDVRKGLERGLRTPKGRSVGEPAAALARSR